MSESAVSTGTAGGLFSKVAMLLTLAMGVGALGSVVGAGITSTATIIVLAILFIVGAFAIKLVEELSPVISVPFTMGWVFISGLFLGPTLNHYVHVLGPQTVFSAYLGTAGVMAVCGLIATFSGVDFSKLGFYLMIALFGLIIVGIVSIFVHLGRTGTMLYSGIGMLVFAGFFLVDFFRLAKGEDTWANAIDITVNLYLDFTNFFLYLLQFLGASSSRNE